MGFNDNLDKELKLRGFTRADVVRGAGIPESSVRSWARGVVPSVDNAYKVACFLGCPLETLIIGSNSVPLENNNVTMAVSVQEVDLIGRFRKLSPTAKDLYLNMAELLLQQEKRQVFIESLKNDV